MVGGELHDLLAGGGRVLLPLARPDDLVRADGEAEGDEDPLHVLLVLADGGGEDARADVRDAGELQEALEGAVLAVRAVEHREDHVDLTEGARHGAGLGQDDLAVGRVDGEDDAALLGLGEVRDVRQGAVGDGHALRGVGGERPAPVRRDADGQHVVLVPVDGAQDGAGRDDGDGVLGAASAEDDGHARLAEALGVLAHIAMRVPCGSRTPERPAARASGSPGLSGVRASRSAT